MLTLGLEKRDRIETIAKFLEIVDLFHYSNYRYLYLLSKIFIR